MVGLEEEAIEGSSSEPFCPFRLRVSRHPLSRTLSLSCDSLRYVTQNNILGISLSEWGNAKDLGKASRSGSGAMESTVAHRQSESAASRPQGLTDRLPEDLREKFRVSAWCNQHKQFGKDDLRLAYELLSSLGGEINASNASLVIHLQTTARCARVLAAHFNQALKEEQRQRKLNLDLVEALAVVHDLGRFSTHAWYINDLLFQEVLGKLEVEHLLRGAVLWPEDAFKPEQDFSDLQRILICADMLAKVDLKTGAIKSIDEGIAYHESSRANMNLQTSYRIEERMLCRWATLKKKDPSKPSSDRGRDLTEAWADVYRNISNSLRSMGIDFEDVQKQVQQGQESVYSKPVVIFDLGGVAFRLCDDDLKQRLASSLGKTVEQVNRAVDNKENLAAVQSGRISEQQWCELLYDELFPDSGASDKAAQVGIIQQTLNSLTIEVCSQVTDYASELKKKGFTVVALSDTIPGHIPTLQRDLGRYFDRMFYSPEIGVSKKGADGYMAFWVVIAALGVSDMCSGYWPANILFHDDRTDCCAAAQKIGIDTVQWKENAAPAEVSALINTSYKIAGAQRDPE